MSSFKYPDLAERQRLAAAARDAMLKKFRAASQSPAVAAKRVARVALNDARVVRAAEREFAKKELQAENARQAARAAERVAQAQHEKDEAEALLTANKAEKKAALEAEQKAVRDARYAARKSAKKERRRGY
ncbi:MAG: DUF6481 family protein [Pseudorhodoplanes sp.]|nr:DUF6481 family protein [Pseudorhodoplanes sp.]